MVAAVASLLLVAPTFAQAAPVCGSTEQQWGGGFDGDFVNADGHTRPMSIEVALNAAGELWVTTELVGTSTSRGSVIVDRLRWSIPYPPDSFIVRTSLYAENQGVTCSGGVVTEFTGLAVNRDFFGYELLWGDFVLARR